MAVPKNPPPDFLFSSSSFTNLIFDFWKSSSDISAIVPLIFPPNAISKSLYRISPFATPEDDTDKVDPENVKGTIYQQFEIDM